MFDAAGPSKSLGACCTAPLAKTGPRVKARCTGGEAQLPALRLLAHETRTRRAASTIALPGTTPAPCRAIHSANSTYRRCAACGGGRTRCAGL